MKYDINVHYDVVIPVTVYADSEEEAIEKAKKVAADKPIKDFPYCEFEDACVTDIKDIEHYDQEYLIEFMIDNSFVRLELHGKYGSVFCTQALRQVELLLNEEFPEDLTLPLNKYELFVWVEKKYPDSKSVRIHTRYDNLDDDIQLEVAKQILNINQ